MDKVKFFTHYERPECDCEYYEPGTSLTVPDQVEPVSVTVARCLRGEVLSLRDTKPTYYENNENTSIDDALDRLDPTTSPGFDLADVPSLVESAKADHAVGEQSEAPKESEPAKDTSVKTESQTDSSQSKE